MKKKIIALMVCVMLVSIVGACGAEETGGKVESVEIEEAENSEPNNKLIEGISDGGDNVETEEAENDELSDMEEYEGKVLTIEAKITDYYENGEKEVISEYEYDTQGNITGAKEFVIRSDGSESESERKCENEYDEKGNLVACVCYNEYGDFIFRKEWKYDESGNMVEYAYSERESEAPRKEEGWKYDEKGNQIEHVEYGTNAMYDENGNISYVSVITNRSELLYDNNGNQIECIHYDSDGNIRFSEEWKYDENGNRAEYARYHSDGDIFLRREWKYDYDENGNPIEITEYDSNGNFSNRQRLKYDEKGNQIQCTYYDENGEHYAKEEWKYDEKGNMAEYTNYSDEVISRHVEYITIEVHQ